MGFAITDAVRLAGVNRRRRARIDDRLGALVARVDSERTLLEQRRREVRASALVPVLDAFGRLRSGAPSTEPSTEPSTVPPADRPVWSGMPVSPALAPDRATRTWPGRAALAEQQQVGAALDRSEAALGRVESRWADGLAHSAQVRAVLSELQAAITDRLPAVAGGGPVAGWTDARHADAAALVDLVAAATALSGVAPVDPTGGVTRGSRTALADARSSLAALPKGVLTRV